MWRKFEIQGYVVSLSHLELDEGELRSGQEELRILFPDWIEPVVPHWLRGVFLVLLAVLLMPPDLHNNVGIDHLTLLAVIRPRNVLTGEDLHSEMKAGVLCPVQLSSIARTVVGYWLPARMYILYCI